MASPSPVPPVCARGPGRPARTGRTPAPPRRAAARRRGRARPPPRRARRRRRATSTAALAVLDRVDQQVAQDPLDPAGSTSATHGSPGRRPDARLPRRSASGGERLDDPATMSRTSTGSASRTAAPASNRLISSRSASSASNRSSCLQQLRRAGDLGAKSARAVVEHVGGHPDRGQRGAQLVRDVGDEPPLHPGQLLQLADLLLQAGGHLVERRGQPGQVVLAAAPHPLVAAARRRAARRPAAAEPHRRDHLPGDQRRRSRASSSSERDAADRAASAAPGRASPARWSAGRRSTARRTGRPVSPSDRSRATQARALAWPTGASTRGRPARCSPADVVGQRRWARWPGCAAAGAMREPAAEQVASDPGARTSTTLVERRPAGLAAARRRLPAEDWPTASRSLRVPADVELGLGLGDRARAACGQARLAPARRPARRGRSAHRARCRAATTTDDRAATSRRADDAELERAPHTRRAATTSRVRRPDRSSAHGSRGARATQQARSAIVRPGRPCSRRRARSRRSPGARGRCSIFERSRWTWTFTSRVSAACR